ncbi:hypothetical protein E2C01_036604 [Portunus trituberculatus]|uniref:Uncharacterized protein n=1 Tax=Portunus trituberculatus TaxID=210409 RepID=A0A5B7FCI8_PORTR|nr:hypothetical protein [Portunus trituberculatus]
MHLPHIYPSHKIQNEKWVLALTTPWSSRLGRGPNMSPGRTPLLITIPNAFTPTSTFSTLISATFAVLDLIFNL